MRLALSIGPGQASGDAGRRHLNSHALIIGLFVSLLVVSLAASWEAIDVVNGTRAYATGEGRYSKAEKAAVIDLHRYAYSRNERDYRRFLEATRIPRGDHFARAALERTTPDIAAARNGFLEGENNPSDVDGMIRLFRWFSWWKPFADAVGDWREGDRLVIELLNDATALHSGIKAGSLDSTARASLLSHIDRSDDRMSALENRFSAQMGVAARDASMLVVVGLGLTMVVLWAIGIGFATKLLQKQLLLDRRLSRSERRFRDFAEVASDWYWEMDRENRITYMSDRFFEILKIERGAVIGANGAEFIRNSTVSARDLKAYDDATATREPFRNIQVRLPRTNGSNLYWSISGKPRVDVLGHYEGYRGVASDITTQIRDAQTMQESKDRAEVANRAKSEFLANMSHELRTPLNAILGFSEVIAGRMLGREEIDRYAEYAADIHSSGAHLLSIINDILDLSKIEAGHAEIHESDERLDEIAASLRTLLDTRLVKAGVSFVVSLPTPSPAIRVDRRKLLQVLANLLSNAAKFTPQGGRVALTAHFNQDGSLAVCIEDTGIGIAPEDIETVLSPFGQIESVFSRQHHGTGLGLPLARALVELHGGALSIKSSPKRGTIVTVNLPATRVLYTMDAVALEATSA